MIHLGELMIILDLQRQRLSITAINRRNLEDLNAWVARYRRLCARVRHDAAGGVRGFCGREGGPAGPSRKIGCPNRQGAGPSGRVSSPAGIAPIEMPSSDGTLHC